MPDIYSPLEMMEKLIGFDTVSHRSNLPLIDFVQDYLAGHGITSHLVPNDDGTKSSLYAHIGPMIDGGVVLSGHSDVVPVVGQSWDTDPFKVVEKEGKYFGRGTCDMKGFVALALAHVPQMLAAGLKTPIQIAISYDEEVGCTGAPPMIADMVKNPLPTASTAIIGEPSMMKAVNGHKGSYGGVTHVRGFEVHSSLAHTGVSAVMVAARLIEWLSQNMAENIANHNPDTPFVPPFTTLHAGTIKGGTAGNITAKDCTFNFDFRVLPSESALDWKDRYTAYVKQVEAEMQAIQPDTWIDVNWVFGVPSLQPETNGPAEELVRAITGDNSTNVVSYGTEAGQFQEQGYSSIICGPGSIEQAHQANEYITVAQYELGAKFMRDLIKHLS